MIQDDKIMRPVFQLLKSEKNVKVVARPVDSWMDALQGYMYSCHSGCADSWMDALQGCIPVVLAVLIYFYVNKTSKCLKNVLRLMVIKCLPIY